MDYAEKFLISKLEKYTNEITDMIARNRKVDNPFIIVSLETAAKILRQSDKKAQRWQIVWKR